VTIAISVLISAFKRAHAVAGAVALLLGSGGRAVGPGPLLRTVQSGV